MPAKPEWQRWNSDQAPYSECGPWIGLLMSDNLPRESGVTERLYRTAGGALITCLRIFLALALGVTMEGSECLLSLLR